MSSRSSLSTGSNPFVGPDHVTVDIRNMNIQERVPIRLSQDDSSYYPWKTYFNLVFREYHLQEHIDGSVVSEATKHDAEWSAIDVTLICWFFQTILKDLFCMVVQDDDDAYSVWTKLNELFTDNRLQHLVFLQQEFFGCHQNNSSVDDFCMRLKRLCDELHDTGEKISSDLLLSTLVNGLNEEFSSAATNLTLIPGPTFPKVVTSLKLKERRMKQLKVRAVHIALTAGTSRGAPPPSQPPAPPTLSLPLPFPFP